MQLLLAGIFFLLLAFTCGLLFFIYRLNRQAQFVTGNSVGWMNFSLPEVLEYQINKRKISELNISDRNIKSTEELSEVLQEIAAIAKDIFVAEAAEVILMDEENGVFHSSGFSGSPLNRELAEHTIVSEKILFAGRQIGSIDLIMNSPDLPAASGVLLKELAVQAGVAVLNTNYTKELLRLKRAAEESVRAKTGFLASLSHEIRGPLGVILNASEILLNGIAGAVNDQQARTLQMVKKNGDHLLELVSDVLDYAKIEAGKIQPKLETIEANQLLSEITKMITPQSTAKSQKLVFKASDEKLYFQCDRRHSRQMLINMLTNAVKYTHDGGRVDVWAERSSQGKVKINVKDTGVGIPDDQQHKVFEAFERVEDSYAGSQVGTGLGMPLTRKLARLNGANVDFYSKQGEGSHFWLMFNAELNETVPEDNSQVTNTMIMGKGQRICLFEPHSEESEMLAMFLKNNGFKVYAYEKLTDYSSNDPALLIIENSLLDKEKSDALQSFLDENDISSPVLLLSSRAFEFDVEHYLKSGADYCLSKPFKLDEFNEAVQMLLTKK